MFVPQGWRHDLVGIDPAEQWSVMKGLAQHADAGPWESIWVYDHFHTVPVPSEEATHEAWTLISAFGAVTERVRLGQMCTCMSYRNPVYLAKVAATCDIVSGGRVEMGIGAGWYEHEWRAYGYGFPPARERLRMLDEGVQIMRQAWTKGVASLDGKHYQVDGAIVRPLPLQEGGIPLWIAGGGEKVTLQDRGEVRPVHQLRRHAARLRPQVRAAQGALPRRSAPTSTRSSARPTTTWSSGATEAEVAERREALRARLAPYLAPDRLESVHAEPDRLHQRHPGAGPREARARAASEGLGYAIINFPDAAYDRSGIELFEREVIPQLA